MVLRTLQSGRLGLTCGAAEQWSHHLSNESRRIAGMVCEKLWIRRAVGKHAPAAVATATCVAHRECHKPLWLQVQTGRIGERHMYILRQLALRQIALWVFPEGHSRPLWLENLPAHL